MVELERWVAKWEDFANVVHKVWKEVDELKEVDAFDANVEVATVESILTTLLTFLEKSKDQHSQTESLSQDIDTSSLLLVKMFCGYENFQSFNTLSFSIKL